MLSLVTHPKLSYTWYGSDLSSETGKNVSVLQPLHRMCDGAYHNWESVFVGEDAAAGEVVIHEGASGEQNGCLVRCRLVEKLR